MGGHINQRDKVYMQRLFIAWGYWTRAGRTHQNILGFPRRSVEYGLMRGEGIAARPAGPRVPHFFNIDKQLELCDAAILKLPEKNQLPIAGYYIRGMSERDLAAKLNCSRRQIRSRMAYAYEAVFQAVSRTEK